PNPNPHLRSELNGRRRRSDFGKSTATATSRAIRLSKNSSLFFKAVKCSRPCNSLSSLPAIVLSDSEQLCWFPTCHIPLSY
ncbi:hypothetical protein, partial [Mesorhizobium sp.]